MLLQKGFTVWFTGPEGAGKKTLSNIVHHRLQERGVTNVEVLDADTVNAPVVKISGYTREDRATDTMRLGWVAHLLTKHKVPNLVSAVSPLRESRDEVRRMIEHAGGKGSFVEVYVEGPAAGVVEKAAKGGTRKKGAEPYEPPHHPEVHLRRGSVSPEDAAAMVLGYLENNGFI